MTLLNSNNSKQLYQQLIMIIFQQYYDVYKLIGSCSTGTNNAEVRFQV